MLSYLLFWTPLPPPPHRTVSFARSILSTTLKDKKTVNDTNKTVRIWKTQALKHLLFEQSNGQNSISFINKWLMETKRKQEEKKYCNTIRNSTNPQNISNMHADSITRFFQSLLHINNAPIFYLLDFMYFFFRPPNYTHTFTQNEKTNKK